MSTESDAAVKNTEPTQPLKTLGKYQIERKLGQGGMGTVYLATNTDLKKLVALKVLPRDKAKNPILVRRFKAEAQAAGQLEHPNIVAVYDTGEADGYLYIAMEYVDGIDLFEQVKRGGPIPIKNSIEIIKQVASALQHAFEHNIVHRDIKPSNLLLKHDGTVKLTDLGLARSIDDTLETNITRAGTTVGTVDYMAPEQARNSKFADVRSDIYSLGCTWYQMLTGEPPYPEGSVTNKLQAHAIKPLPDPREINDKIPEGLIAILHRMTAKKPDERYQTPAELLDDLMRSKLTKAAFSNEIFSDLSDYDVDAAQNYDVDAEDDDDTDYDERDEVQPDTPTRKRRSSPEDPDQSSTKRSANRKIRSRVEHESESDSDFEPRRKPSSGSSQPRPLSDTQPLKSSSAKPRPKPSSKPQDEDEDDDSGFDSGRSASEPVDEDSDQPSSSRGKRRLSSVGEGRTPSSKSEKVSPGRSQKEKRPTSQHVPKPLPPKREPTETDEPAGLNVEVVKYLGIAAGVLATIGGLGWLIAHWGNQIEAVQTPINPQIQQQSQAVVPNIPSKTDATDQDGGTAVAVVEPGKAVVPERATAAEYDIARQALPRWTSPDVPEPTDLPVFSVGTGAVGPNHFASLDEALRAVDKAAGGVVRLLGNGPFVLPRLELGNAKRIVMVPGAALDRPMIIVASSDPAAGLILSNGQLDLRGLHFAVERSAQGHATATNPMITVVDGQLFIRRCSFTATGDESSVPSTALAFVSRQDSQTVPLLVPELLLDRVTVRGNGLTGLKVDRTTAEIVVQDSLFVTGIAPALNVSGALSSGLADAVETRPRRTIRFLRSTLSGRKHLLEFSASNATKPPSTSVYFQDSICSAEGSGNSAVLLSAIRWPSITTTSGGWLTNLNWSSQSSFYVGFERLIDLDKSSYKVAGLDAWQRVWGKKFEPAQFQSLVWQESLISDLSTVMPHDFDNARFPFHDLIAPRGNPPGCTITKLTVPGFISQSRLMAIGHRPKWPAVPADSPITKKVNLLKEDLGAIINRNDWPNGSVFEATGSGLVTMLPARIEGKSLRVIFRQGDGPSPLRIQPKTLDQKGKPDQSGLFTIEKGSLDLQAATLESSQSPKGSTPPWLIASRNATVILRGCRLSGPTQLDVPQHQGLIEWGTTAANPSASDAAPYLAISDSILITTGIGIRFAGPHGNLFARNCIVATRGYGIDLQPNRTEAKLLPSIDLQHVTFSAAKAAFRFEAVPGTDPIETPMRLFIDHCAIVTPLEIKAGESAEAAVLECLGPAIEQKQVEWWGNSNGIAKELKSLLRRSTADPVTSPASWHEVWGDSNDIRLLTGPKGVQLKTSLANKLANLKPASFLLDPTSAGASWAEGGRAIGADVMAIEDPTMAKKGTNDSKSGMTGQTGKPSGQAPSGKKNNPGF